MDTSVPRVTVWHHSAEPRDAKTMTFGTDLSIRTSHLCQIHIFLHTFLCQRLNQLQFTLKNAANLRHPLCLTLFSDARDMNTLKAKRHRNSDTENRQQ